MHPGSIPGEASTPRREAREEKEGRGSGAIDGEEGRLIDETMNADFSEMRLKMIDGQIRTTDVTHSGILLAMGAVPREAFVAHDLAGLAYIDEDLPIAEASAVSPPRFLMEPSPFAKLLQLADVRQGDEVLVIGAGTGYSAAVMPASRPSSWPLNATPNWPIGPARRWRSSGRQRSCWSAGACRTAGRNGRRST